MPTPDPERRRGQDQLASNSNYLIGNDESNWQTNVDNFASVYYENVYDGIDLRYYGNQRQLEYDFVVAAETDPNVIRLSFDGIVDAEITETGELRLILNEQGDDDLFQVPDQLSDRRRWLACFRSRAPMSSTTTAASVSRWATMTRPRAGHRSDPRVHDQLLRWHGLRHSQRT